VTIADEIAAETRKGGHRCLTCRIIEELGDEGPELVEILAGRDYSNEAIARALTKRGHNVSGNGVRGHRLRCVNS
jgi:hypothetical protein